MAEQTTDEHYLRDQMVELGASLFARGFSVGTAGNISTRIDSGFLMTPTNVALGRLSPMSLSVLSSNWEHLSGLKPSKEVVMHRAMYEARPDAQAVVHLHSLYVTAISCLASADERPIPPLTPYFVMRLGRDISMVPYYKPGSAAMLDDILKAATQSPAVILANHGSIVAGKTLEDAVNAAEEMEVSAQLSFLLEGRRSRPLNEGEIGELLS